MSLINNQTLNNYSVFTSYESVFSPDECEKIRSTFDFQRGQAAALADKMDHSYRNSILNWIFSSPDDKWIFDRIEKMATGCNNAKWKFQISGLLENIQFGYYEEGSLYNWHQDNGNGVLSTRKLSVVVNLSRPEDYEGGDLEFIIAGKAVKSQGSVIIFPSYQIHRVSPILCGQRFSLAAWISGDTYK